MNAIEKVILSPVILRGTEGAVAESIIQKELMPTWRGDRCRQWVRFRDEPYVRPASTWRCTFSQRKRGLSLLKTVDSATSCRMT